MDNEDTSSISRLTKYDFVPSGLLNYYINIEPKEYFKHFKSLNLKEVLKFDPTNLKDGFFIRQTKRGYEYLFVERQHIKIVKRKKTYNRLLKYLTYYKLNLYAPKKYKIAWWKRNFA